jgi:hypothetical protein
MLSTCHALLAHTVLTAGVVASIGAAARASNRIGTSEPSAPHKHARTSNRRSGLAGPRLAASACSAQPSWGPGPVGLSPCAPRDMRAHARCAAGPMQPRARARAAPAPSPPYPYPLSPIPIPSPPATSYQLSLVPSP